MEICVSTFGNTENSLHLKSCPKNIQDRLKTEIMWTWPYNYIDKNVRVRVSTIYEFRDFHVRGAE